MGNKFEIAAQHFSLKDK
jgi:hypothetical protein